MGTILIDNSVNYAMNKEISFKNLEKLINIVDKFDISVVDVDFENWKKYKSILKNLNDKCRIVLLKDELDSKIFLAQEYSKIKIKCDFDSIYSDLLQEKIKYLSEYNCEITLDIKDSARVEIKCFIDVIKCFLKYDKVKCFCYNDENSRLDPVSTFDNLMLLKASLDKKIEFRCGNSNDLATANALSAAKLKDIGVNVSFMGVNNDVPIEEYIMANNYFHESKILVPDNLSVLCHSVADLLEQSIPLNKAVIGKNIFAHESGIHVAGVVKCSDIYEAFPPEIVGLKRKIIIGKHSGKNALKFKFDNFDIKLSNVELEKLLIEVKKYAYKIKSTINDKQLLQLYIKNTS